jgi:hypothetical protein
MASFLLSRLKRIAALLEECYVSLSYESINCPEIENHSARTKWNNIRRKLLNGSFFVLAEPLSLSNTGSFATDLQTHSMLNVDFAQNLASVQHMLQYNPQNQQAFFKEMLPQPRRLADMHTPRAAEDLQAPSTFETQQQDAALKRMSKFITTNISKIQRLSRLTFHYDSNGVMAAYGKQAMAIPLNSLSVETRSIVITPSSSSNDSFQELRTRGNNFPLPAPQALRVNTQTHPRKRHAR